MNFDEYDLSQIYNKVITNRKIVDRRKYIFYSLNTCFIVKKKKITKNKK